ncbi:alpha/beta fold hydrolase [Adhaeribacter rhizoryzae]|uniref:Alpha/beta fold hydrolase n=1 Tax=Adhaeribacter rhizoryzae TaxID=2607907 RepID=A0A5M6CWB1_9BACT|nr:alpha/beta fold hydrolase [Adhaeribacter rhizoryzae]KAA5539504.1 alpha/beta fold hydrolase [Adhaeribacter rhizoryzae]
MEDRINASTIIDSGGNGKVLVFLHGFLESKELWLEYTKPLQQDYRVILLDLPGHGNNTYQPEKYSMDNNAAFVREALQSLNINQCILIGHSMGGYTAMAFAEKYPELLSGVVMFHSSALPDTDEKKENRDKTIDFIQKHGAEKFMETFVAPLFYEGNRQSKQATIQQLTQTGKKVAPEAIIGTVKAMRDRPDRTKILSEVNFPFLFIAGKQDAAVTLEQTLQQCHLPKTSYTLFLDQTGHMGMFERPHETLTAIKGFVAAV